MQNIASGIVCLSLFFRSNDVDSRTAAGDDSRSQPRSRITFLVRATNLKGSTLAL